MGTLYKLTFDNGKCYIGVTTLRLHRRMASHRWYARRESPLCAVHRAWKKYGEPVVTTLAVVCDADLYATEVRAIAVFATMTDGYNSTPGGEESPMKVAATAKKVSDKARTPERIARNLAVHLGSKRSAETRALLSAVHKGRGLGVPKSQEHRKKISEALLVATRTYVATAEHRAKISAANSGRKFTPEHKAKIAAAVTGRKLSDETRQKLSDIAKARRTP